MEKINTPFGNIEYVGDLLSKSYTTTIVYKNENGQPVIVEWIDEINGKDYFIIFKTETEKLQLFFNGIISHFDFIKSAKENKYYNFLGSINASKFNKLKFTSIDSNSLPKETVYFNSKYSLDFDLIAKSFNIKIREEKESVEYFDKLKNYSKNVDSGLFRLHILEGKNVGHGTADTKALGQLLISFEDLYHEIALDYITGVERKVNVKNLHEDISISDMSTTEIYIQEAASFSIYLKSKVDDKIDNKNTTVSDEIFTKIDNILSSTTNKNELQLIKKEYSLNTFKRLVSFTETIMNNHIVVDLEYYNSNSQKQIRNVIKPANAHLINNNIISYSKIEQSTLPFQGKFTNLNTKTGYFVFFTKENREISGYVSNLIKENMISFNFTSLYKVTVTQNIDITLDNKNKIYYTLESCLDTEK